MRYRLGVVAPRVERLHAFVGIYRARLGNNTILVGMPGMSLNAVV